MVLVLVLVDTARDSGLATTGLAMTGLVTPVLRAAGLGTTGLGPGVAGSTTGLGYFGGVPVFVLSVLFAAIYENPDCFCSCVLILSTGLAHKGLSEKMDEKFVSYYHTFRKAHYII